MTVRVTAANLIDAVHDEGHHIVVVDGHLHVQTDDTTDMDATVAIYTPKSWLYAVVEDAKTD